MHFQRRYGWNKTRSLLRARFEGQYDPCFELCWRFVGHQWLWIIKRMYVWCWLKPKVPYVFFVIICMWKNELHNLNDNSVEDDTCVSFVISRIHWLTQCPRKCVVFYNRYKGHTTTGRVAPIRGSSRSQSSRTVENNLWRILGRLGCYNSLPNVDWISHRSVSCA